MEFLLRLGVFLAFASLAIARAIPALETPQHLRTVIRRRNAGVPLQELVLRSRLRAKHLYSRIQSSSSSSSSSSNTLAEALLQEVSGGFTMEIHLGTPPQKLEVLFDTGSDLIWVDCSPDDDDDEEDASSYSFFNSTTSSTYRGIPCDDPRCDLVTTTECNPGCQYQYEYGGGAETYGRFSTDSVSLATTNSTPRTFPGILFGCGDENYGFQGLHGIAGFGRGNISLISQLGPSINRFSYCLSSSTNSSPLFYGTAAVIRAANVQTTPILTPSSTTTSFYFLNVTGVSVGGSPVFVSHDAFHRTGGTIFDSGTTITYLPQGVYTRVRRAFTNLISLPEVDGSDWGLDLCYDTSSAGSYVFPTLGIQFQNASMNPLQGNYFFRPAGDSTVCLALASSDGLGINIIGNMMQQGFHILYNTAAATISFAPATCEKLCLDDI